MVGGFGWFLCRCRSVISSGSFGFVLLCQCSMNWVALGWM